MVLKSSNWSDIRLLRHPEHYAVFKALISSSSKDKFILIGEGKYPIKIRIPKYKLELIDLPSNNLKPFSIALLFIMLLTYRPSRVIVLGLANQIPAMIYRLLFPRAKYYAFVIGEFEWYYTSWRILGKIINLLLVNIFRLFVKLFGKFIDGVYAISTYIKRNLISLNPSLSDRVIVYHIKLPNKLVNDDVCGKRIQNDVFRVLTVAGIEYRKGIHDIIKVATYIARELRLSERKVEFVIKGAVRDREYYNKIIRSLKMTPLNGIVRFITSFVRYENMKELYYNSHIFLFPTYADSLGIAVLEALYNRLPVIAYLTGGVKDMVKNGFNGFLVEQGNWKGLAELVLKILDNPVIYYNMCINTRSSISGYYEKDKLSFNDIVAKILKNNNI